MRAVHLPRTNLDARDLMKRAAIMMTILGLYLQMVEWVDLFPWNNIKNGNGQETVDIAMGVATIVLVALLWRGSRIAAFISTAALCVWTWLQVKSWWIPYVVGASLGWTRHYEHWFGETTSWLPRWDNHLPPDANHLVLHVLLVLSLAACVWASLKGSRRDRKV